MKDGRRLVFSSTDDLSSRSREVQKRYNVQSNGVGNSAPTFHSYAIGELRRL